MDIELMNADPKKNLTGHLKGKNMNLSKVTLTIGIIEHDIIVIIVDSMGTFQKIALPCGISLISISVGFSWAGAKL